jgi:hypothetical protein
MEPSILSLTVDLIINIFFHLFYGNNKQIRISEEIRVTDPEKVENLMKKILL